MTKFLLDSGDPDEYREIAQLARQQGTELWGATTNPSLIAKKLAGKKITHSEALALQKDIVMEIVTIVPGAVSAEVYADLDTTAEAMVKQGEEIASWHERVFVKLPTTTAGFKARTELRRQHVPVNNTLVFSQEQVFAICLHEKLVQKQFGTIDEAWAPFISPFVGRLDDRGEDGMTFVRNAMKVKQPFSTTAGPNTWMLVASVRRVEHFGESLRLQAESITAPAAIYREWLSLSAPQIKALDTTSYASQLKGDAFWQPSEAQQAISSLEGFDQAIMSKLLNIDHTLTTAGIERFVADWRAILKDQ